MLNFEVGKEYQFYAYATDEPTTFVCRSIIDNFAIVALKDEKLAAKYYKYNLELNDDHITYTFHYFQPNCWGVQVKI